MACVQVRSLCSRLLLHSRGTDALSCTVIWRGQIANYAVAKRPGGAGKPGGGKGKLSAPMQKRELEVETDADILCTHACGVNIYKDGTDPVLKPDSEYPDWLWTLRLDREPIPLEDLDQNEPAYWKRLKRLNLRQNNEERKHKVFEKKRVNYVPDDQ